jgi:RNA polymerase sigma-70 factor, ECF subfamily
VLGQTEMAETSSRVSPTEPSRGRKQGALALHLVRSSEPAPSLSDAEVVAGLQRADLRAQRVAWDRYAPTVYRLAHRALGSTEDARDVMQDTLACVFAKAGTIDKPDSLKAFVMSVMIRTLKYELRRRRMRRWLVLSKTGELPDAATSEPDHASRQLLRRFYDVLDTLGAEMRLVFVLRRIEGLTLEEVAETMGLSLATVKRRLALATEKLSVLLDGDPELVRSMARLGGADG